MYYGNVTGCHGKVGACAHNVYLALSPPQLKGPVEKTCIT